MEGKSFYMTIIYMPYSIRKVKGKPCYRVYNKKTKKVFAKCSTPENAKKQLILLRALQYNKNFVLKKRPKNKTAKK